MEGDFPVSEQIIVFCHFSGDIFFAEEVHDEQVEEQCSEGDGDVVDVSEEVDVCVVFVEVGS